MLKAKFANKNTRFRRAVPVTFANGFIDLTAKLFLSNLEM